MEAADIKDLMARSLDGKLSSGEEAQLSALLRSQPRLCEELERMAFARVEGSDDSALDAALKSARNSRPAIPANTSEIEAAILSKAKRGRLLSMRNIAWLSGATAAAAAVVIVFNISGNTTGMTNGEGNNGGVQPLVQGQDEGKGNPLPPNPSSPPSAQDAERVKKFNEFDANGDGRLTGDEIPGDKALQKDVFRAEKDDNGDGAITLAEFSRSQDEREMSKVLREMDKARKENAKRIEKRDWSPELLKDKNNNGRLERNETPDKFIADFDANKDGFVTKEEYVNVRLAQGDTLEFMTEFDTDKDSLIAASEITDLKETRKLLDADTDGDHKLNAKEIEVFALNNQKLFAEWLCAKRIHSKPANGGNHQPASGGNNVPRKSADK